MRSAVARNDYTSFWHLLAPDVVAGGEHVHPGVEQLEGDLGRDAGAVGRVLAVGDHEVDGALVAKAGQPAQQRFPARLAEHVTDEEDVHARHPA
jgi:predicted sugar kinase